MLETYFGFLRRGGQADLRGAGKVVEDLAPGGVLGRAAAVALVDDDEVEEAGRELAEELLPLLRAGDGLIEAEIDLVGGVDAPLLVERERSGRLSVPSCRSMVLALVLKLRHRRAERAEVVDHRLVDQDVAVGEEQDALLAARLPQPPDDLERGVGLAGAGRHDEQDAVLALGDGLDGGVDGVDLVVARRLAAAVVEVVLKDDLLGFGVEALPGAVARPQSRPATGRRRAPRFASIGALCPVRSWNTKPSPLEENTKGMSRVAAYRGPAACRRRRCGCCPSPRSSAIGMFGL